jgi:hypothetical protein
VDDRDDGCGGGQRLEPIEIEAALLARRRLRDAHSRDEHDEQSRQHHDFADGSTERHSHPRPSRWWET